jgi:uncharacterized protein YjbI with pentapeptide repeats
MDEMSSDNTSISKKIVIQSFSGSEEEMLLLGVSNTSRLNLSARNLSGINLSGIHLNNADLSQVDLSGADLSGTDLRGANLREANLYDADLRGADLREANLSKANMRKVKLGGLSLSGLNLSGADLQEVDLSGVNFYGSDLSEALLCGAKLSKAVLGDGLLRRADLSRANLSGADLRGTNLSRADLSEAILQGANLQDADLRRANLSQADLREANLAGCLIYAISAWDVQLENTIQLGLIITDSGQPTVTVDNLEVAQFINLLLTNKKIRDAIDAVTSKVVLILGRFTPERKQILDAIRDRLRSGYIPVMFDFEKPSNQDLTETVSTLAHLSRFIIADLTDPSSVPYELHAVVPNRMVPVLPLLKESIDPFTGKTTHEFAMFSDLRKKYHWVLPTHFYKDLVDLLASFQEEVIELAEKKAQDLEKL